MSSLAITSVLGEERLILPSGKAVRISRLACAISSWVTECVLHACSLLLGRKWNDAHSYSHSWWTCQQASLLV